MGPNDPSHSIAEVPPVPPAFTEMVDGAIPPQPDTPPVSRADEERSLPRRLLDLLLGLLPF